MLQILKKDKNNDKNSPSFITLNKVESAFRNICPNKTYINDTNILF